jgi:hypothetical protein
MQEETNSVLYQRKQDGWSKMSIKVLAKTYETDYEMPRTSGVRGRRKPRKFSLWVASLYLHVCVRACASQSVRSFLCMIHMKQTL